MGQLGEPNLDDWGSHQRSLIRAAVRTPGDILELGVGWYSTPLLQEIAGARGDRLVSFESNGEWAEQIRPILQPHASLDVIDLDEMFKVYPSWRFGLVFLDQYGPSSRRWPQVVELGKLGVAKTVVVHDAHAPTLDAIRKVFTFIEVVRKPGPPTLIASNLPGVTFG